jgi:hypothetical protein
VLISVEQTLKNMQLIAPSFYIFTTVVSQMIDFLACTPSSTHRNQIFTLRKGAASYFETSQQTN